MTFAMACAKAAPKWRHFGAGDGRRGERMRGGRTD